MFTGSGYVVPPRPTYAGPCTCVWPSEYARQQVRAQVEQEASAKADAIANPLGAISAALPERFLPGGFEGVHQRMENAAEEAGRKAQSGNGGAGPLDEFGRTVERSDRDVTYTQAGPSYGVSPESEAGDHLFTAKPSKGSPPAAQIQQGRYNPEREDPRIADDRAMRKAHANGKLATRGKHDPLGRAAKKWFAKSSETKMRELTAYREDVVVMLRSLIPEYSSEQSHRPAVHRDSLLCTSCMVTLTHYLYYSPTRFEKYLSETSTRAYLTLVDDAVASSHTQTPMEAISHHELERIARGELAAIEWRLAMKVARFHKKTDILNLFPVRVGEYAELQANPTPPSHPEGVLKKAGKKVLHTMGFGTGVTGTAHAAKEASTHMPSE